MDNNQLRRYVEKLCQKICKDQLIIQGAGGNVSWKTEDHLWIKLSGAWLEEAHSKDIFGSIQRQKLDKLIQQQHFVVDPTLMDQDNVRPSIEVMLHAIISKKFVFHLHMVEVVAALINNSQYLLDQLTDHHFNAQVIPYHKPGEELASAIYHIINNHPDCDLLCLENHGVVLFSDDINDIESQIILLQNLCKKELTKIEISAQYDVPKEISNLNYELLDDLHINSMVFSDDLYKQLGYLWPICPDHIVFLGPKPYLYDSYEDFLNSFNQEYKPPLIFIKNKGILINRAIFTKIHFIQLQCFADILFRLDHFCDIPVISENEIQKLLSWDAEKYRQQINQ